MHFSDRFIALFLASLAGLSLTQQIAQDPGVGGVPIEIVHFYNDEYPQGQPFPLLLSSPFTNKTPQASPSPPAAECSPTTPAPSTQTT